MIGIKAQRTLARIRETVPDTLLTVRPMRGSEAHVVAGWVSDGRRMGVFRPGPGPNARALRRFQAEVASGSDTYGCLVVEYEGELIGYADYRVRGTRGEALGIYVTPAWRRRRVASHLLRCIVALLRDAGCRTVEAEVFEGNAASRRMLIGMGFTLTRAEMRTEDPERVLVMRRRITRFPRLGPHEHRYHGLKGENLYLQYAALAEAVVDVLRTIPGVELVLGLGSLPRRFGDEWSDLDIGVLARGPAVDSLWRGEQWVMGVSIDLFAVDLESCPPAAWDAARKQAFEESIVLAVRSQESVRQIRRALRLGTEERKAAIADLVFRMGWLGFAPREWFMTERFGYLWSLPPDVWLRRGSVPAAHLTADQVLDMELSLLFLANDRRVPDPKWRRFLAPTLPWLPPQFQSRLSVVESAPRTQRGFKARSAALLSLVEDTIARLEDARLLGRDMYGRFLQSSADYDSRQ